MPKALEATSARGFSRLTARDAYMQALFTPAGIDQLLTPAQASTLFNVQAATIRKWSQLGHIKPSGIDNAGRKLYRLRDIAEYEKSTRVASGRENREKRAGLRISA